MQLKYNGEAEKSEVFVISACGFDSIPAESGILYAKQKFQGRNPTLTVNTTKLLHNKHFICTCSYYSVR